MSSISQQVADLIQEALDEGMGRGEDIQYDVSMIATPGPQGQPQPLLGVTFTIQAMNLDQAHALMIMLPPSVPRREAMDDMLRKVVEGLIQTRLMAAQQEMVQANGHKDIPPGVSKSGLILPGQ